MSPATLGLLIGGALPALLFGMTGILQKTSTRAGVGVGPYLVLVGLGVVLTGFVFGGVLPDRTLSARSGLFATLVGVTWGFGMGFVAIGLARYGAPLSKLVPLYNMNTLIVALLALVLFAEWREVNGLRLFFGAALVVIGGLLVARA
ncbi:MAG: hypothetical protein ABIK65_06365 [Candidatus Eisenbacteria bacterium]